jgi:putative ABC transport system permease protein
MRLYRWLLQLSPEPLRRDYGAAMEEMFARRLNEARSVGPGQEARVWLRESASLLALAMSERWGPAARMRRRQQRLRSGPKAGMMDTTAQEIRHAARRLVRTPLFTLTAASTLALAIAANASIFTVVHRVVINSLPYPESGRLIALDYGFPARNMTSGLTSMAWQLYYQLADHARTLEGVAVYTTATATLTGGDAPERVTITHATPSLAPVLRVSTALGRWFTEAEGETGAAPVAVLSYGIWMRRFGGDRDIVGRPLSLDGVPTEVVGIMPASFSFPDAATDLWTNAQSTRASASFLFSLNGIARLSEGASVENARAEITTLIQDLSRRVPNQRGMVSAAVPLQDLMVGRIATALWVLLASAALVLLVACANVANLFLVRSETRQREIAVRRALGAGNRGVARYYFTESALLALIGVALGLILAWGGVQLLVAYGPPTLPRLNEVRIDGVVLVFALGLCVVAAAAFGVIPLLRLAPLAMSLHENGRGQTATRGSHRARQLLMGGQVALALILLVASGLMVRSFQKLRAVDPGFDPSSTLTFSIGLPDTSYPNRQVAVDAHQRILDRIEAVPGVARASVATCLPLSGGCFGNGLRIEGEVPDPNRPPRAWVFFRGVGAGYIEAMGMSLLQGRGLERADIDRLEANIVVNKAFADAYFPGEDPIGKRVRSGAPSSSKLPVAPWMTIVGVVSNMPSMALSEPTPWAQMFMPMSIAGGPDIPREALIGPSVTTMNYVVRSATPPSSLVDAVRDAVDEIDPNLAIAQVRSLQEIVDRSSDQASFTVVLLAIAATVALLLGAIGIYGVVSYIVTQRTGEIGVRLAMGAEPRTVAGMILWQGGVVILAGVLVGLLAALAGSRLIQTLLYGVSPRDPAIFAATTVFLVGIALIACWLPARRAARLSPLDALRTD